jgi:hypothetical protein
VGLSDLEGELLIMPSKDLLPSLHQLIAAAFLKNHAAGQISNGGTFSDRGQPYKGPRGDMCSFHLLQNTLFVMGWCYECQVFTADRWTHSLYGRVAT